MIVRRSLVPVLLGSLATLACGGKKDDAPAAGSSKTPPAAGTAAPAAGTAAPAAGTAAPAAGTAAPAAGTEETDPSATTKVTPKKLTDADLEGLELKGERQQVVGWTDTNGTGALVITKQPGAKNGGLLLATILYREGDGSWTTDRDLKELVDECENFDLTLEAQVGDWTVSDLDGDGRADITVAWNAGCRSDVSPVAHKVLLVVKGEKYALRGDTKVSTGGGDFKADDAFAKAPPAFLAHAEKVWKATVTEAM